MSDLKSFEVGELVTFLTHPLFKTFRIKGDGKLVPPIMVVKEVFFENKQKKVFDEASGKKIADRIKYTCVYFDDNKCEFVEVNLYHSMLRTVEDLKFEKISSNGRRIENYTTLVQEVNGYSVPSYEYGKTIYFKTLKLEIYKKRTSKKIPLLENSEEVEKIKEVLQYVVNYSSPEFVICGFKEEMPSDLFYGDGKQRRKVAKNLLKVKWFNPFQQKFCEQYLPEQFFTDDDIFGIEKHNTNESQPENPIVNPAKDSNGRF